MIDATQLSGLSAIMPGTQSVTYYVKNADQSFAAGVTVERAEKRPLTRRDFDMATIRLDGSERVFHLWTNMLSGISPKQGDKIVDSSSVSWIVVSESPELIEQRWRLLCNKVPANS